MTGRCRGDHRRRVHRALQGARAARVLDLATEACRAAIADAGLDPRRGRRRRQLHGDARLGAHARRWRPRSPCRQLRYALDIDLGGQAPCHLVSRRRRRSRPARPETSLVFRALNGRSRARVGTMQFPGMGGQYRYPIGYDAYLMYVAMWAQRFLHETGQGEHDLGAVAVAQRDYGRRNERALPARAARPRRYLAAPYVVEPFRAADCTVEVDGACAVRGQRARRGPRPARTLRRWSPRAAYRAGPAPGPRHRRPPALGRLHPQLHQLASRDELFGRAGVTPADVDFAEIYDCFTSTVLMGLEGLGLASGAGPASSSGPGRPRSTARCRSTPTAACSPRATCTA